MIHLVKNPSQCKYLLMTPFINALLIQMTSRVLNSGTRKSSCMAFLKPTACNVPKLTFTTFTVDDFSGRKPLSEKNFYETSNNNNNSWFTAWWWLYLLSNCEYLFSCATCRRVWKSVISVSWGDACWETEGSSLELVREQAAHRTSSASVFLSSLSVYPCSPNRIWCLAVSDRGRFER